MSSIVRLEVERAKLFIKERLAAGTHGKNEDTIHQAFHGLTHDQITGDVNNKQSNHHTNNCVSRPVANIVHDSNHVSWPAPLVATFKHGLNSNSQSLDQHIHNSPPTNELIKEPIRKRARIDGPSTPVSHHHQSSLLDVPTERSHQAHHGRNHIDEATESDIKALYQSIIDSRDQLSNEPCEFDSDDDFVNQPYSQTISQSISPAVCPAPHPSPMPTPLVIGQSIDARTNENQSSKQSTDQSSTQSDKLSDGKPDAVPAPTYNPFIQGCRSVFNNYNRLGLIDEGTYGVVYKALDKETNKIVALKRLKLEDHEADFPITTIREINLLLTLPKHANIVHCKEVVTGREASAVYLVMEYAEFDLKRLCQTFKHPRPFNLSQIKLLVHQLLSALSFLHSHSVIHRDIKMANLLYSNNGCLKLCDFGLARRIGCVDQQLTALVVTLWFRSPELLMGAEQYDQAIDMWSVGCVIAELIRHEPLFPGSGEMDQLSRIFSILGSPNMTDWPDVVNTSHWQSWSIKPSPNRLNELFPRHIPHDDLVLSEAGFDLLSSMLRYDPNKRITATQSLQHPWFTEEPRMASIEEMPKFEQPKKKGR